MAWAIHDSFRTTKMPLKTLDGGDDEGDEDGDDHEGRIHGKTISPGPAVKFSDESLHKSGNSDEGDFSNF